MDPPPPQRASSGLPINRLLLDPSDLLATLALDHVQELRPEAPWYGFYGLILLEELNTVNLERKFATLVFPQLPVSVKLVDDDGHRATQQVQVDEGNVARVSEISDAPEMDVDSPDNDIFIPPGSDSSDLLNITRPWKTPTPPILREGDEGFRTPTEEDETRSNMDELDFIFKDMTAGQIREFVSTRIPDFTRKRLYLGESGNIKAQRVDLLVELKRQGSDLVHATTAINEAHRQVLQQAGHAFAEDQNLAAIGYIIASGHIWKFGEVNRTGCAIPSYRGRDSTYEPSSSHSDSPRSQNAASSSSTDWSPLDPKSFQRSANPSPLSEYQKRLQSLYNPTVITPLNISERKQWFTDIKERLDELDGLMVEAYTS